jgi:drug/metabolite transporter (DMT)-like permease
MWGVGAIMIKLTTSPVLVVTFYRHVFWVPILALVWAVQHDRTLPWRAALPGGVIFAAHQFAYFGGLRYSTAAIVTIVFALTPLVVGTFSGRVVGERTSLPFYLWSIVAIGGCALLVLVSSGHPNATPFGTLLALANLGAWSVYFLATKRARTRVPVAGWLLIISMVSGACIGLVVLITTPPLGADSGELVVIAFIALVPGTIGHFLVTWAHPRIHVAASSTIGLGVPVVAAIGAAIFLDEPFGPLHALGVLIAIGGALAAMRHLPPVVTQDTTEHVGEIAT